MMSATTQHGLKLRVEPPADSTDPLRARLVPVLGSRKEVQAEAKALGLPATGKTEDIARLVNIARADPRSWSRQEFNSIVPHLFIHQDLRDGSNERMKGILADGLSGGMVDSFGSMVTAKHLTWGRNLKGSPAYLFLLGQLRFKSNSSPWLAPGCKPLFAIKPIKGQEFFEAMQTAVMPEETQFQRTRVQNSPAMLSVDDETQELLRTAGRAVSDKLDAERAFKDGDR